MREVGGDAHQVRLLYGALIRAWNEREAGEFGACFARAGSIVGFDGSQVNGASAIVDHLAPIFASHPTPTYVTLVEDTRALAPGVVMLRAVSGLVPREGEDLLPGLNAVQTMIATKSGSRWQVEMFQATPARFDMHPELADALTERLRAALRESAAPQQSSRAKLS